MRVRDVMSTEVKSVAARLPADEAWRWMRAERIHHLVVLDGKAIAGVISDRDAGGPKGAGVRAGHDVGELMTRHVVTVTPDTTVKRVANLMRGRSIGCAVVTDKGRVAGIVTTSDLLELLGRGAIRPTPTARRPALNYRAPHRKRHKAYGVW
jgi:CBS domain-containing protein